MKTGTPQYSRTAPTGRLRCSATALFETIADRPTRGSAGLLVTVPQQCSQAGQARVDLLVGMRVPAALEPLSAYRAQPGAVRATQGEQRLRQPELVVEDRVELDLVVVVDPRDLGVLGLGLHGSAAHRIDGRQELLADRDAHLLHERIGAARARAPQR